MTLTPASLCFILLAAVLLVYGFYLIHPPLALIAGAVVSLGIAALFWEVEE